MKKHLLSLLGVMLMVSAGVKAQVLTADPIALEQLNYSYGQGPSVPQTYTLEGQGLEGERLAITAPEQFEISFDGNSFRTDLEILIEEDSTLANQPVSIYVRLKNQLQTGNYQGSISNECENATLNVQVSGSVEAIKPTVILNDIYNVAETSTIARGTVTDDGGDPITERGICWNTTGNPSYLNGDDHLESSPRQLGEFEVSIQDLNPNTTYFVRVYAINSKGIAYSSNELQFTTTQELTLPRVLTLGVTDIGMTSARGEGDVIDDGHLEVISRGICWNTSPNPTIDHYHSTSGMGLGSFSAEMPELTPGTTYYVRAYATNNAGSAYGENVVFTTIEPEYSIEVEYGEGGMVDVEPRIAQEHTVISITVEADDDYELSSLSAFKSNDTTQTVAINENHTFEMPAFDVMVKAVFAHKQGFVDDIETPNPICSGDTLYLTEPDYGFPLWANHTEWQLSATQDFNEYIIYEGQPLDASYNGWWLRFMVSYFWGNSHYSNSVSITVNDMEGVFLLGETNICKNQEAEYFITGINNDSISWQVTDPTAQVTIENDRIKVLWASPGQQQVLATVKDLQTNCSIQLDMDVTVNVFIDAESLNEIVKKDNYILVYPNPKDGYKYQWYKDGIKVEGANKQFYYQEGGLDKGIYKVYVSNNEDAEGNLICGAFTQEIIFNGQDSVSMSVYPNPAHAGETFIVVNNDNEETLLTIYDLDGRKLHCQTISGGQTSVNISLSQGIYIARLANSEGGKTEKIVIQ